MKNNIGKKIFLIIFILILTVPLLLTNTVEGKISATENRVLKSFPKLYDDEGELNWYYTYDFEEWFNDNIGLRDFLFDIYSKLQYDVFKNSPSENVKIGKDGWLFYNDDSNIQIAANNYPYLTEEYLQIICDRQIQIKNKLAEKGIEYVLAIPPSKVSIYPEYIKGNFSITRTPADILVDYLEAHSDVKIISFKQSLLDEKNKNPGQLLYYKTDTHWNSYGIYIAYKELVNKMQEWGITNSSPAEVNFSETVSAMRDLTGMMFKDDERYTETSVTSCSVINPKAQLITEGEKNDYIQNFVQANSLTMANHYINEAQNGPSAVVYVDSMFMSTVCPLLAENFSALTNVWSRNINEDFIDYINPDVVILEMTERFIYSLLYENEDMIQPNADL